jgi:hypothetical protein
VTAAGWGMRRPNSYYDSPCMTGISSLLLKAEKFVLKAFQLLMQKLYIAFKKGSTEPEIISLFFT